MREYYATTLFPELIVRPRLRAADIDAECVSSLPLRKPLGNSRSRQSRAEELRIRRAKTDIEAIAARLMVKLERGPRKTPRDKPRLPRSWSVSKRPWSPRF